MSTRHETHRELMKHSAALRYVLVLFPAFCVLAVLLFGAARTYSPAALRRPMRTVLQPLRSAVLHESSAPETSGNATPETFGVEGSGGLGAATLVKQNLGPSTSYTIHVRLSGGTEQLIPVTAPPGGLQFEVRDMTGDNVPNDLVLRPAVIHWPLIVLLNDGHNHFTVAISATLPSSLDSGSRASRAREIPETVALTSTGSKAGPQASRGQVLVPSLQRDFVSPFTQRVPNRTDHRSASERAPPTIATRI
jgi:hypothetical protein